MENLNAEKNVWNDYWGSLYNQTRKESYRDLILDMGKKRLLGKNILDLGCGYQPIISSLPDQYFKKIYLDLSSGIELNHSNNANLFVRMDVHDLLNSHQKSYQKYMKKIFKFLGEDEFEINEFTKENLYMDTIVYSDILNYIDYQQVFKKLYRFLRVGGRKIIFNKINMGIYELFSPLRPKSNWEILRFLQMDLRMVIEFRKAAPIIWGNENDFEQSCYIFVAKKKYPD